MSSPTDQALLDSYRNALSAIAGGQSYSINGRTVTRADLKDVWTMVQTLEARIAIAAGDPTGTGIMLARFN